MASAPIHDGIWCSSVTPEDTQEIVQSHFQAGIPEKRLTRNDATEVSAGF